MKYIVTSEPKELFNVYNESLGMSEKRALFYLTQIGKRRWYRRDLNNPGKGFKILQYSTKEAAEKVALEFNTACGEDFKVEEMSN